MNYLIPSHSTNQLVHRGFMDGEIWVKIGVDNGRTPTSSTKMCYQICNVATPNDRENSVLPHIWRERQLGESESTLVTYQARSINCSINSWGTVKERQRISLWNRGYVQDSQFKTGLDAVILWIPAHIQHNFDNGSLIAMSHRRRIISVPLWWFGVPFASVWSFG